MKSETRIVKVPLKKRKKSIKLFKIDFSCEEVINPENIHENVISPLPNIHVDEIAIPFWFSHQKPEFKKVNQNQHTLSNLDSHMDQSNNDYDINIINDNNTKGELSGYIMGDAKEQYKRTFAPPIFNANYEKKLVATNFSSSKSIGINDNKQNNGFQNIKNNNNMSHYMNKSENNNQKRRNHELNEIQSHNNNNNKKVQKVYINLSKENDLNSSRLDCIDINKAIENKVNNNEFNEKLIKSKKSPTKSLKFTLKNEHYKNDHITHVNSWVKTPPRHKGLLNQSNDISPQQYKTPIQSAKKQFSNEANKNNISKRLDSKSPVPLFSSPDIKTKIPFKQITKSKKRNAFTTPTKIQNSRITSGVKHKNINHVLESPTIHDSPINAHKTNHNKEGLLIDSNLNKCHKLVSYIDNNDENLVYVSNESTKNDYNCKDNKSDIQKQKKNNISELSLGSTLNYNFNMDNINVNILAEIKQPSSSCNNLLKSNWDKYYNNGKNIHLLESTQGFMNTYPRQENTGFFKRDYLASIEIYDQISRYIDIQGLCSLTKTSRKFRSEHYMSIIKKRISYLIMKGLNHEDQYIYWDHFVNFNYLQNRYNTQYLINLIKPSPFQRDILSDLDRTRAFNDKVTQNQKSLYKILVAISNSVSKIGYVQGLNTIVAVFFSHNLTESEIYWLMNYALKKCKLEELFSEGFPRVQILNYQLEIFMRNYLPDIVDYLGEKGINLSYFTTQWFITFFSYDLQVEDLTKIWNLFFIRGWKVLIRVALVLMCIFKDLIFAQADDELPAYLKNFIRENLQMIAQYHLFDISNTFKVTNRLLKTLETLYEHSAPCHVILALNHLNKLEWKILPDDYQPSNGNILDHQIDVMDYLNSNLCKSNIKLYLNNSNMNKYQSNMNQSHDMNANHKLQDNFVYKHNNNNNIQNISNDSKIDQEDFTENYIDNHQDNDDDDNTRIFNKPKPISLLTTLSAFGKKIKRLLSAKDVNRKDFIYNNNNSLNNNSLDQFNKTNIKNIPINTIPHSPGKFLSNKLPRIERFSSNERSRKSTKAFSRLLVTNNFYDIKCRGNDSNDSQTFRKSVINLIKDENDRSGCSFVSPKSRKLHLLNVNNTNEIHETIQRNPEFTSAKVDKNITHSSPRIHAITTERSRKNISTDRKLPPLSNRSFSPKLIGNEPVSADYKHSMNSISKFKLANKQINHCFNNQSMEDSKKSGDLLKGVSEKVDTLKFESIVNHQEFSSLSNMPKTTHELPLSDEILPQSLKNYESEPNTGRYINNGQSNKLIVNEKTKTQMINSINQNLINTGDQSIVNNIPNAENDQNKAKSNNGISIVEEEKKFWSKVNNNNNNNNNNNLEINRESIILKGIIPEGAKKIKFNLSKSNSNSNNKGNDLKKSRKNISFKREQFGNIFHKEYHVDKPLNMSYMLLNSLIKSAKNMNYSSDNLVHNQLNPEHEYKSACNTKINIILPSSDKLYNNNNNNNNSKKFINGELSTQIENKSIMSYKYDISSSRNYFSNPVDSSKNLQQNHLVVYQFVNLFLLYQIL